MRVCFLPHVDPRDRLPGAVEEKCDGLVQFVLQHPTLMESFLAWLAMASGSTLGTPQWRYPPISITLSPLEKQHQGAIQRMAHDLWRACRETAGPDQSARDIWDRCRGRMLEVMVCDIVTKKRASGSDRAFGQSRVLVNGKSVSVGPRDSIDVGAMSRKGCATDVAAYKPKSAFGSAICGGTTGSCSHQRWGRPSLRATFGGGSMPLSKRPGCLTFAFTT